jgi:erythromycin esterase
VCLRLSLRRGEFARVTVEIGTESGVYLEASVLGPDDSISVLRAYTGEAGWAPLSWEARSTGVHSIVLSAARTARNVSVTVTEVEDSRSLAARRQELARDPRVAWLTSHAIPIRTLQPTDTNFRDLRPLIPLLANVRVVLLGEADHGDGSDFLAKSRLIRFLHAELGFDVLAFEAGVYDMWRAWREISAGRDPMASFTQGAFWMWAQARQLEPLVSYVAQAARSPRPLVLAGIDINRSGRTASSDTLVAELTRFLQANGIDGPLANAQSPEIQLLTRVHNYQRRPQPDSAALAALHDAACAAAGMIDRDVDTEEGRYWSRVLWTVAVRVSWASPFLPGGGPGVGRARPYCQTEACRNTPDRDPEMGENLKWLANRTYPGRKIIVWAHNAHIARNFSLLESGRWSRYRYMMGDAVWSEFGDRSYSIAFVSYEGSYHWAAAQRQTYTIVPDQQRETEFEELMAAVGRPIGMVDLRRAGAENTWLAHPFLARPLQHSTDRSPWASNYDAFLFIKTQEPSMAIPFP